MSLWYWLETKFQKNPTYIWPPIWVFFGLAISLACVAYCNHNYGKMNVGAAFLWSIAFFISGCLLGFIFGVPNTVNQPTPPQGTVPTPTEEKKALSNTNFTQVSDWLTKIVIGAGLVELNKIPPFVFETSKKMAMGVAISIQYEREISSICAALLIFNVCFGFLCGYMLMRIIFLLFI
jgi:hypothetical protein